MGKKLILVASPPACGKTYVSELIAKAAGHIVYLDKDDLCDLLRASFSVAGEAVDMDGNFYISQLRPAEYSTILKIAFSALRFEDLVILNAPFGKEVRDPEFMRTIKEKANEIGAELMLIWVTAPLDICHERMKQRNSDRDLGKLANWEEYVKNTNYSPPCQLEALGAVDSLMIFDTKNDETTKHSLTNALKYITGEELC